jgi:hypothetical protein
LVAFSHAVGEGRAGREEEEEERKRQQQQALSRGTTPVER